MSYAGAKFCFHWRRNCDGCVSPINTATPSQWNQKPNRGGSARFIALQLAINSHAGKEGPKNSNHQINAVHIDALWLASNKTISKTAHQEALQITEGPCHNSCRCRWRPLRPSPGALPPPCGCLIWHDRRCRRPLAMTAPPLHQILHRCAPCSCRPRFAAGDERTSLQQADFSPQESSLFGASMTFP